MRGDTKINFLFFDHMQKFIIAIDFFSFSILQTFFMEGDHIAIFLLKMFSVLAILWASSINFFFFLNYVVTFSLCFHGKSKVCKVIFTQGLKGNFLVGFMFISC